MTYTVPRYTPPPRFKHFHEHLFLENRQSIYNRCLRTLIRSGLVGAHKNGSLCHIYSPPKPLSILVLPSEWQVALHTHIHNVRNYIAVCHLTTLQRPVPILQFSGMWRRVIWYLIPQFRGDTLPPSSFLKILKWRQDDTQTNPWPTEKISTPAERSRTVMVSDSGEEVGGRGIEDTHQLMGTET